MTLDVSRSNPASILRREPNIIGAGGVPRNAVVAASAERADLLHERGDGTRVLYDLVVTMPRTTTI